MNNSIEVKNIEKTYGNQTKVLDGFSYQFEKGKLYAIMGRSGAGKSTLLNILGTIDQPTSGSVLLAGDDITRMSESVKVKVRMNQIGFVFQGFYLNPYLSALDNVIAPMRINYNIPKKERKNRALQLLGKFGAEQLAKSRPSEMSGGEQQRVCIARALANDPTIILADEPTGNLDEENERIVFTHLKELAKQGRTVIVVSHNESVKDYADELINL